MMNEHVLVLNDGETFTTLAGSMVVEIVHDLERDPVPEDQMDAFLLDLEARSGGEVWVNEESGLVGLVITRFA